MCGCQGIPRPRQFRQFQLRGQDTRRRAVKKYGTATAPAANACEASAAESTSGYSSVSSSIGSKFVTTLRNKRAARRVRRSLAGDHRLRMGVSVADLNRGGPSLGLYLVHVASALWSIAIFDFP